MYEVHATAVTFTTVHCVTQGLSQREGMPIITTPLCRRVGYRSSCTLQLFIKSSSPEDAPDSERNVRRGYIAEDLFGVLDGETGTHFPARPSHPRECAGGGCPGGVGAQGGARGASGAQGPVPPERSGGATPPLVPATCVDVSRHPTTTAVYMDNSCLLDLLIRCFAMTEPEDLNFTAFTDLCRLCSLKSGPRLHIFDKESEQRQILFKLRTCLPTMQISKDDFLPKKICERCVTRLEQLYEWRQSCLNTDSVLRNYAESMRIVTSTINFQACNEEKSTNPHLASVVDYGLNPF
ncbi:jg11848 [Pararge aegeria aegeria]|uniref:Jg11848 protein n=1 Tax=Pararge aegeria aegeria TaxID=348720 RepID=A0A8S4SEC9_9NEOP|nr:jg11848 [Pararge aegeria aegeria]